MLFELSTGNLQFRLEAPSDNVKLEKITTLLNTIATELEQINAPSQYNAILGNKASTQSDNQIIQNLHQYILNHLDEPLPSLKQLAIHFETNQFKLKVGFRNQFDTSIFQYYNDERLKRAHRLLSETALPLKKVSFLCGFNSYLNFYKAFKKKFGYAPGEITRPSE
ncbi:AraC-like DNA-binding protein [Flavobacterium sp. 102]|nr:AraC-like DNA-binding protein [Flavobacterium sp. 102]